MTRTFKTALVLTVLLALAAPASAGPYLGEWSWLWHPECSCPPSEYSRLHYWAPATDRVRSRFHPAYLDQYPPGNCVVPSYDRSVYRCQSIPPTQTSPYAHPEAYYGRPVVAPPRPAP